MPVIVYSAYQAVLPVLGGIRRPSGQVAVSDVYGTCFRVGDGLFLTAGHTIQAAKETGYCGIGFLNQGRYQGVEVTESEVRKDYDVGLMRCALSGVEEFDWHLAALDMLRSVQSSGYPFALNRDVGTLSVRAFEGYIVSGTQWQGLEGKPLAYELSFSCPRGLSGAPVWFGNNPPKVAGIVIGNSVTEMVIHSEKERSQEGDEVTIYEKTEAMHLGLAIRASQLAQISFSMLDGNPLSK